MAQVLVVDADPAMAGIIEFHLRRGGHRVVVVRTGPDALAAVAANHPKPDLAVLDVAMPGMTGFELLEALRGVEGLTDLGAVFLSGRSRPKDFEMGRHLGAAYLTKPLAASDLLAAVERILDRTGSAPARS